MILKAAAPVSRLGAANRRKAAPHPMATKSQLSQVEVHA